MLYYVADYFALVLLWIVWPRGGGNYEPANKASWTFMLAIITNMLFSISNICNGIVDTCFSKTNFITKFTINTLYYVFACLMIYLYAKYLLQKVDAYASKKQHVGKFYMALDITLGIFLLIVVLNLWFNIIFTFDEELNLVHGFFWIICYVQVGVVAAILYGSMIICKSRTVTQFKNVIIAVIPMVAFIVAFRIIFPQILFEGMAGAATALILMLKFQTYSQELDVATRLGNLQSLVNSLEKYSEKQMSLQIIMLSVRNFSDVNSNYGYERGNRILFKIAYWLEEYFDDSVQLFRYGAASFIALIPIESCQNNKKTVHDLLSVFPKLWGDGKRKIFLSSFCVDLTCTGKYTATRVIEELDYARKKVKYSDRNHMHFDELIYGSLQHRKSVIKYLDKAIDERRFEIWFQPILCVENKKFCSAEALIRLKNMDGKYVDTEEMVSIAEETGQMTAINEIVLDKVCKFLGENKDAPIKNISYNLTLSQLRNEDFCDSIERKSKEYNFDRTLLGLEITERMVISEDKTVKQNLEKLKEAGHIFLLDDFGTGYSNFLGVIKHPLDKIKIDKSLIMEDSENNRHMVKMLIDLFHRNGQMVVAEGIETGKQRDFLIESGADFLQGYFYSRPLSMENYLEFLKNNN